MELEWDLDIGLHWKERIPPEHSFHAVYVKIFEEAFERLQTPTGLGLQEVAGKYLTGEFQAQMVIYMAGLLWLIRLKAVCVNEWRFQGNNSKTVYHAFNFRITIGQTVCCSMSMVRG